MSTQKKFMMLAAGASLIGTAIFLLISSDKAPPAPEAAVAAEQALEEAYKKIEQQAEQKEKRKLEFQGAAGEAPQQAKEPGGGIRSAPK